MKLLFETLSQDRSYDFNSENDLSTMMSSELKIIITYRNNWVWKELSVTKRDKIEEELVSTLNRIFKQYYIKVSKFIREKEGIEYTFRGKISISVDWHIKKYFWLLK